jgi:hypothetical protein
MLISRVSAQLPSEAKHEPDDAKWDTDCPSDGVVRNDLKYQPTESAGDADTDVQAPRQEQVANFEEIVECQEFLSCRLTLFRRQIDA